jgi:ADP-heptose:LPS heptosyltransferase
VSDAFMARHHLLEGYTVLPKIGSGLAAWRHLSAALKAVAGEFKPDLIIDCEPHGMRSTTLVARLGWRLRVPTLGIAQFPLRGWFYSKASVSTSRFAAQRGLPRLLEYTDRDFVVLSGLGIERRQQAIELSATPSARQLGLALRSRLGLPESARLLGLNIGCGTADAVWRRPALDLISQLVEQVQARSQAQGQTLHLVLTGAAFERDVNAAFMDLHRQRIDQPMHDLAGSTSLLDLTGVIEQCSLFISSDSGPYHMAVGLKVPTLALFTRDDPSACHTHPWVRCVQLTNGQQVADCANNAMALLAMAAAQPASPGPSR